MDTNIVECDTPERDLGLCECAAHGLDILNEVHKLYEVKLEGLEKLKGPKKTEKQVEVLRSWVSDLLGQNTLLVQAVQDLETYASNRLPTDHRKQAKIVLELRAELAVLRRRLRDKELDSDRSLMKNIKFYESTEADIFGDNDDWPDKITNEGNAGDFGKHRRIDQNE